MPHGHLSERGRKLLAGVAVFIFLLFSMLVVIFIGRPMLKFVREPEHFRAWVDEHGFAGRLVFLGMMLLQVIIAIIPGEPLEIGAGYAFGTVEGTLLCVVGTVLGSAAVFLFVRYFGIRVVEIFFSREKIHSLKFLRDSRRLNVLTFIVFFIPGTPKDLLSYFIGLTEMKFSTWLLISATARLPSIITSTISGNALGTENYRLAIIAFIVTGTVSLIGYLIYRRIEHSSSKMK